MEMRDIACLVLFNYGILTRAFRFTMVRSRENEIHVPMDWHHAEMNTATCTRFTRL